MADVMDNDQAIVAVNLVYNTIIANAYAVGSSRYVKKIKPQINADWRRLKKNLRQSAKSAVFYCQTGNLRGLADLGGFFVRQGLTPFTQEGGDFQIVGAEGGRP
jgi:hypothetical protein